MGVGCFTGSMQPAHPLPRLPPPPILTQSTPVRAASTVRESIRWGPAGAGVEAMAVANSTRLYRVVLDTYMIGHLDRGSVEWRTRGVTRTQTTGDIILGEPGELYASHRHRCPGTWNALFLAPVIIERAATELGARHANVHVAATQLRDPALALAIAQFHDAKQRGDTGLERDTHLAECVRRLVEHHAERRPGTPARRIPTDEPHSVRRAREYLDAHATSPVSLDDLALAAGVGKYHLVRAFGRVVGVPPHAYQIQLRVALARRLIAAGQPLSQVALDAGFSAQSHLHRHFVRVVGVTPGAFRQNSAR